MAWIMAGVFMALIAVFIMWRTSGWDLWGVLFESIWRLFRGKRTAKAPTAIEGKFNEISGEATVAGKARRAATTVAGHFVAQVLGILALILLILGAALIAIGVFGG